MTELNNPQPTTQNDERTHMGSHGHGSHSLMMMLMCAPMFVLVVLLMGHGSAQSLVDT